MRSLGKPWDECAEGTAKAKALRWDPASLGKGGHMAGERKAGQEMWLAVWTEAAGWGGAWLLFSV